MTDIQSRARAMHTAYTEATGLALPFNMARERAWVEILNAGDYTAEDVRLVVRFIRRGIERQRQGKPNGRNEGALRFSNFTALDRFEEDCAAARAAAAAAKPAAPAAAPVQIEAPKHPAPERFTSVDIREIRKAMERPHSK